MAFQIFPEYYTEKKIKIELSEYYCRSLCDDVTESVWKMWYPPSKILMPAHNHDQNDLTWVFQISSEFVLNKSDYEQYVEAKDYLFRRSEWRSKLSGKDYFARDYYEDPFKLYIPYILKDLICDFPEVDSKTFHRQLAEAWKTRPQGLERYDIEISNFKEFT